MTWRGLAALCTLFALLAALEYHVLSHLCRACLEREIGARVLRLVTP